MNEIETKPIAKCLLCGHPRREHLSGSCRAQFIAERAGYCGCAYFTPHPTEPMSETYMASWITPKIGAPISHDVGKKPNASVAKVGARLGSHHEVWDEKGVRHEVGHVGTFGVPAHLVCRVRH